MIRVILQVSLQLDSKQQQQLLDIAELLLRLKKNSLTAKDKEAIKHYSSLTRLLEDQKS